MNSEFSTQNFGIAGYRLTEQLYESSALLIYRGYRKADEQPVVLKILREVYPTPEHIAWFKREYQVMRNLNLTGVVKPYACLCEQQQQLMVMVLEDFGGDSLARLGIAGKLELREFLELAIAIIQIVAQIHAAQIIHKDINPSNIILNPTTKVVKIIDFGISTVLSQENPTFCHPNILEGTLPYMSPEQTGRMNRAIDYRSDFYSVGVTFYELLTGRLPFESDDPLELVHCHLAKQPPPLRESTKGEIPQVVGEIVMKLMEKNPEDCYQSAYGIQRDLELCLHQLQTKGQIDCFPLGKQDISDKFHIPQKLYGREREIDTLLAAFERVAGDRGDWELGRLGAGGAEGAEGDTETIPDSQFPIPNSQFPIPNSQFPIPNSQFPIPDSRFPIPNSQFPIPNSQFPNNKTKMILISGSAGVGKSALVNEVHKPITAKRGNFISGKFDQYQRNIPYSAISQAFNQLCKHLLSESTATFRAWQEKILVAVGNKGRVLIDVIPNLELVIGQQQAVPQVGLQETQNRFNLVCQNFIKVLCQPEHPLVLFIDDLQWADTASLSLLRTIMSDEKIQHLLIIGAYRKNELDVHHPLKITLDDIKQKSGLLSTIALDNLDNYQVNALIAESLACSATACQPLTDLIYTKTKGNPFFTIEFLRSLYVEGLLSFNQTERQWQWDLTQIQAKNITNNVVELMAGKVSLLPQRTQTNLQLAACIGNSFDLSTLGIISQYQPAVVWADLLPALQAGLVLPLNKQYKLIELTAIEDLQATDGVRFKFLHDQVQEAAYYLMDEDQRQAKHLQIGRLLNSNTKPEELKDTKTAAALDLTSILKASQALASEIVLDNLLTKMLKIIIENAGAEIGYLLMEKNGQWMIEASGKVNSEEVKRRHKAEEPTPNLSKKGNRGQKVITRNEGDFLVELSLSIPIESVSGRSDNPLIANAIVNYVIRTQESVVLNDAAREGNFTRTPYILKQQPKSILSTPLLNQGKLVGILYLENNLTTEAFTPERLEVLNFLSSQAA
ncbi:MAG: AAA family ATPase, partial [Symploca sp. SIO1A3]|nr:AAA family ATPase [Symploca sp. SIO1A3]